VSIQFDKTTPYPGGVFDNRPTTPEAIQLHSTPGISVEHADRVLLEDCTVSWGEHRADSFGYAVEAHDTTGLKIERLTGNPARPELSKAVSIS
jgi:hypothetical protein